MPYQEKEISLWNSAVGNIPRQWKDIVCFNQLTGSLHVVCRSKFFFVLNQVLTSKKWFLLANGMPNTHSLAFNREELHNLFKIPYSIGWVNYLSISLVKKICANQLLEDLFADFLFHSFIGQEKIRNNPTRCFCLKHWKSGLSWAVNKIHNILKPHKNLDILQKSAVKATWKKISSLMFFPSLNL